jgi:hypothetical protein
MSSIISSLLKPELGKYIPPQNELLNQKWILL